MLRLSLPKSLEGNKKTSHGGEVMSTALSSVSAFRRIGVGTVSKDRLPGFVGPFPPPL